MLFKEPEITSKEGLVRTAVDESYLPIQNALRQEYENYPLVCGKYGIVLTRSPWVQSLGIPLQLGGDCERFELEIGIFNPSYPAPFAPSDHTHVRYYSGTGDVLYIDGIYPLLWGQGKMPAQPIVESYREDKIDDALAEKYSLFPFNEDLATQCGIDLLSDGSGIPSEPMKDYRDLRAIMHDNRALEEIITVDSGDIRDMSKCWGDRTTRVLRAIGQQVLWTH